jgi:anaerobic magnesium-protoporphyrin IX monomethyl ester cyclase
LNNTHSEIVLIRHNNNLVYNNTRLPSSINKVQGIYTPLGLAYLAACAEKNGYSVKIIDMEAEELMPGDMYSRMRDMKPDLVGVTSMTPNIAGALEILKITKEVSKDIKTVIGGTQMSVYPKETMSRDFVDFGILGEGEESFIDLLHGKLEADGIAYKVNGRVVLNKVRAPIKNLDTVPFPARHLLPTKKYFTVIAKYPVTSMLAARGCPFNCNFCYKDEYLHYRARSVENVIEEIELCIKDYKVKEIAFYNDCFPDKRWVREMCETILRKNIKVSWSSPQRIDLVDKELLTLMKRAGCTCLRYGVESGDQFILNMMNKKTNLEELRKVFKITHEVGIDTFGFFMIGYAYENEQTIRETINFAKELNPDWVMFTVATPLPNTEFMNQVKGKIDEDYWIKETLGQNNGRIPYVMEGADKWCGRAYKEFYLRPQFVIKKVKSLRNFDQFVRYAKGGLSLIKFRMVE